MPAIHPTLAKLRKTLEYPQITAKYFRALCEIERESRARRAQIDTRYRSETRRCAIHAAIGIGVALGCLGLVIVMIVSNS